MKFTKIPITKSLKILIKFYKKINKHIDILLCKVDQQLRILPSKVDKKSKQTCVKNNCWTAGPIFFLLDSFSLNFIKLTCCLKYNKNM